MRHLLMRTAYRQAVSMFGSEHYRKAFRCCPRLMDYNSGFLCARSPLSLRLGSLDELREALRLKISACQGLGDESCCVTWFAQQYIQWMENAVFDFYGFFRPHIPRRVSSGRFRSISMYATISTTVLLAKFENPLPSIFFVVSGGWATILEISTAFSPMTRRIF